MKISIFVKDFHYENFHYKKIPSFPFPPCPTPAPRKLLLLALANQTGTDLCSQPGWRARGRQGQEPGPQSPACVSPQSPSSPRLRVREPGSAHGAVAGTHTHTLAHLTLHMWAGVHADGPACACTSPQTPPGTPPVRCAPTPGARTPSHAPSITRPGLHLIPSPNQQLQGNAGTTGWVPPSMLVPTTAHTW